MGLVHFQEFGNMKRFFIKFDAFFDLLISTTFISILIEKINFSSFDRSLMTLLFYVCPYEDVSGFHHAVQIEERLSIRD